MTAIAAPVPQRERIDSLDVLRGFALLGILLMNINMLGTPFAAYFNPLAYGDISGVNYAVWLGGRLFADQKFMTIFSLLFGAGIILFTTRVAERGSSPAGLHYRRSFWLLVFGLAHAYLIWYGDILVLYAVCAMVVYPLRHARLRTQLIVGLVLLTIGSLISIAGGLSIPHWPPEEVAELRESYLPSADAIARELAAYRGGYMQHLPARAKVAFEFQTFVIWIWGIWRAGGLMLIGMALYRWGVFSAQCSPQFYRRMALIGGLAGLPLIYTGVHLDRAHNWDATFSFFLGDQFNYWGSLGLSSAYIATVMLVCRSGAFAGLRRRLRAVGQMAFTNYLMHSVICTTIFYGHGFGYFGKLNRLGLLIIVLGVWVAQLIYSAAWLEKYRFGPFEWAWRTLTYGQGQPWRRPPGEVVV
jgi:uncharacterized protein